MVLESNGYDIIEYLWMRKYGCHAHIHHFRHTLVVAIIHRTDGDRGPNRCDFVSCKVAECCSNLFNVSVMHLFGISVHSCNSHHTPHRRGRQP
jgi:hypothetical protein